MDYNAPDYEREDHQKHFAVGAMAALGTRVMLDTLVPDAPRYVQITVPILASVVLGGLKELSDARHPESHCAETGDWAATGLGGVAVSLSYTWAIP